MTDEPQHAPWASADDGRIDLDIGGSDATMESMSVTHEATSVPTTTDAPTTSRTRTTTPMRTVPMSKVALAARMRRERNEFLKEVIASRGADALVNVAPLSFSFELVDGIDPSDPSVYMTRCVRVTPRVSRLMDAILQKAGATPRGRRTYSLPVGDKASTKNLSAALSAVPGNIMYPADHLSKIAKKGGHYCTYACHEEINYHLRQTPAGSKMIGYQLGQALGAYYGHQVPQLANVAAKISTNNKEVFIQFVTLVDPDTKQFVLYDGAPNMHLFRLEGALDPVVVTPDVAVALAGAAAGRGYEFDEPGFITRFRDQMESAVIAQQVPGAPGLARLLLGAHLPRPDGIDLSAMPGAPGVVMATLTANAAGEIVEATRQQARFWAIHPDVEDMIRMAQAETVADPRYRPHQNEAIALHRATRVGYVNGCSVGSGKTAMAYGGCAARAADHSSRTGERVREEADPRHHTVMVSMQKTLIDQWAAEASKFFPEAAVHLMRSTSRKDRREMWKQREEAALTGTPFVALISYETVKSMRDELLDGPLWDEIVVDEATCLISTSERSLSLWALRQRALCAVALTGTPIEKGVDDMGRIVAWARNDAEMFHAKRLSKRFPDLSDPDELSRLWRALGRVVFRRDSSEISDELPGIDTQVVKITLHPSEIKLGLGARRELKRMYLELLEKIERASALNPSDPALEQAKQDLQVARGAVLGGVTLSRLAVTDPEAVRDSESLAAAVLDDAGLIQPAVTHGLVKRRWVVDNVAKRVAAGEAVLVFTEFASVANHLLEDFEDAGVRVALYTGGVKQERRAEIVNEFQGVPCEHHRLMPMADRTCHDCEQPQIDVIVMTQSATHGLNLQRATTIVNQELPYLPSRLVQRLGRSNRIAEGVTDRQPVTNLIPLAAYGSNVETPSSEEIIAANVFARAATSMIVLDAARGIKGHETEFGQAIKGLDAVVSEESKGGNTGIFDLAKSLLAEDGAHLPNIHKEAMAG